MTDADPRRWIETLEDLFGPRIGRLVAVCLLALACLAAAIFLLWVIWAYGGNAIFDFLSELSIKPTLDSIDAAVATLIWTMVAYGVILVAILYFFGRALFRRRVSQKALDGLAELRNRAINTLWAVSVDTEDQYTSWKSKYDAWCSDLLDYTKKNFPRADYLNVQYLGALNPRVYYRDPEKSFESMDDFYTSRNHLERRLEIIELILNAYRGR